MAIRDIVPFGRQRRREGLVPGRRYESPLTRVHEEIDRLFEDFFSTGFPAMREAGDEWGLTPDVDVQDTDKEIRVKAELPGVDEDGLDVRIDNNALTIRGEKREESEDKDKEGNYYRSECRYGSFMRTIPLNAEVDADKAEANFKNGVLRITLPKLREATETGKRIRVMGE